MRAKALLIAGRNFGLRPDRTSTSAIECKGCLSSIPLCSFCITMISLRCLVQRSPTVWWVQKSSAWHPKWMVTEIHSDSKQIIEIDAVYPRIIGRSRHDDRISSNSSRYGRKLNCSQRAEPGFLLNPILIKQVLHCVYWPQGLSIEAMPWDPQSSRGSVHVGRKEVVPSAWALDFFANPDVRAASVRFLRRYI